MLSRSGGRPGIGGGFDVISLPVVGSFDHSSSPGVGTFDFNRQWPGADAILDFRRTETW